MRWEDERYIRLYTRDTTDWLALSFDAQALLALLLRKVDRAGLLALGKHGKRGVAIAIGHPREWPRLEPALEELLTDGCVRLTDDGATLLVPNFIDAQEARASDKARQAKSRELAAAVAASNSVTRRDAVSQNVTERHMPSHAVTTCHTESQPVTPRRAVPSRAVPNSSAVADAPPVSQGGLMEVHEPPAPAKKPRKEASGPHAELWRALEAEYEKRMGAKYASGNGGADASTVSWLLAQTTPPEAVRRWGLLLEWSKGGFPNVGGFVSLRSNWNAPQVVGLTPATKGGNSGAPPAEDEKARLRRETWERLQREKAAKQGEPK